MQILVHEPTSRWTAELEREFLNCLEVTIRWRPDRADLIQESPMADAILIVTPANDESLDLLSQLRHPGCRAGIVCLIDPVSREWEWIARELGADVVLPDITEIDRLTFSVRRLLKMSSPLVNGSISEWSSPDDSEHET